MFNVTNEMKNNITILRLSGSLTSDSIKLFNDDLMPQDENMGHYLFDFKDLEIIDSTGLSYIIKCLKLSIKHNTQIKLLHLENQPKVIFEITRVDSLFELYDNESKALNSFKHEEHFDESLNPNMQQTA